MKLNAIIDKIKANNTEKNRQELLDFLMEHLNDPIYLRHEITDAMAEQQKTVNVSVDGSAVSNVQSE